MRFITFYTLDTLYEDAYFNYLKPTLDKFHLSYWAKPIANKGTWYKNACQKPAIVLEALNEFKEDVTWIDCDATIERYPDLLFNMPLRYELAVCYLDWLEHYGRAHPRQGKELIDGTIFFRNTDRIREFVKDWKRVTTDVNVNHQKPLQFLLTQNKLIDVYHLDRSYCYIASTPRGKPPVNPIKDPVIIHYQASRIAKESLK